MHTYYIYYIKDGIEFMDIEKAKTEKRAIALFHSAIGHYHISKIIEK